MGNLHQTSFTDQPTTNSQKELARKIYQLNLQIQNEFIDIPEQQGTGFIPETKIQISSSTQTSIDSLRSSHIGVLISSYQKRTVQVKENRFASIDEDYFKVWKDFLSFYDKEDPIEKVKIRCFQFVRVKKQARALQFVVTDSKYRDCCSSEQKQIEFSECNEEDLRWLESMDVSQCVISGQRTRKMVFFTRNGRQFENWVKAIRSNTKIPLVINKEF